jgi:peptidylprolyl isomerase domain and WD repeat-containing protein 1
MIGKTENQRYMNIALYQGAPKKKSMVTIAMAASDNQLFRDSERRDPTIICTAFKQNRFYLFSQRYPEAAYVILA